jgi:hypothetical protein
LQLFITNQSKPGNKVVGYYLKDGADHERKVLEKKGYVKEN